MLYTLAEGAWYSNLLMVGGVVLLLLTMMFSLRRRTSRNSQLDPREKIERDRQTNSTRNDLRQMMVELEEVTRQFSAQLDAKSRRLEKLIEQADQCIAKLSNGTSLPPSSSPRSQVQMPLANEQTDPLTQSVYQLADKGVEASEIARRLNEHVGKIELILALRQHG